MTTPTPPQKIIDVACETAALATCAKSKRGVVVFETITTAQDRNLRDDLIMVRGIGFNGPPAPVTCDGSPECRKHCPSIAVHAERRALDQALSYMPSALTMRNPRNRCDLLHVKVDEHGELVPTGTPSCAECSKHILDLGIRGVWLFEDSPAKYSERTHCPTTRVEFKDCPYCQSAGCGVHGDAPCTCATDERHRQVPDAPVSAWRYHQSLDFHTRTLAHERNRMYRGPLTEEFDQ